MWPEAVLVSVTSPVYKFAKPLAKTGVFFSRRRFEQAWKKKEQAGW